LSSTSSAVVKGDGTRLAIGWGLSESDMRKMVKICATRVLVVV
jgi:hypothetical protein